jgi:hypothetical protein
LGIARLAACADLGGTLAACALSQDMPMSAETRLIQAWIGQDNVQPGVGEKSATASAMHPIPA